MIKIRNILIVSALIAGAISIFTISRLFAQNENPHIVENQQSQAGESHKELYHGLTSENIKDREQAAEDIRNDRSTLIKKLIQLAGEKVEPLPNEGFEIVIYPWHDSKHLSMLLLGDLHADEAVPVLLKNLEYKNPRSEFGGYMGSGGWYPAAESLSKIGIKAVDPVIKKLTSYDPNSKGSNLCCWILKEILGDKLARYKLQLTIEETKDENVKKKLTGLLPNFKTEQEKAEEEYAQRKKQEK